MDQITIVLTVLILPLFLFMLVMPRMTLNNLKCGVVKEVKTKRFYLKAVIYFLLALYLFAKTDRDIKTILVGCALIFLTFWYVYHAAVIEKLNRELKAKDENKA